MLFIGNAIRTFEKMLVYYLTSPSVPFLLVFHSESEARQAIAEDGLTGTLITVRCNSPPEIGSELEYSKALLESIKTGKVVKTENFY
jgi:hypothetical protein